MDNKKEKNTANTWRQITHSISVKSLRKYINGCTKVGVFSWAIHVAHYESVRKLIWAGSQAKKCVRTRLKEY